MAITREQLQADAVRAFLQNKSLIVNWGTGVGKSRVAVEAVRRLIPSKERILLLVSETAHKANWRREFIDALGETEGCELFGALVVECHASLHKYENTAWDVIIIDEGHHLRSERRTGLLSTITSEYVLVLTATLSEDGDADNLVQTLDRTFKPFEGKYFSVQDAIDNAILGEPKIFVHYLPLRAIKAVQTIVFEWGMKDRRVEIECDVKNFELFAGKPKRYPHVRLTMHGTAAECYDFLSSKVEFFKKQYLRSRESAGLREGEEPDGFTAVLRDRMNLAAVKRKRLLGQAKTTFARWLLAQPALNGKKLVCFCSDVDQAEALGGENAISARRNDCETVIARFNADAIRTIFAVDMIKEGSNLKGIQAGVVIQLGGKERDFIQKFGRVFRCGQPEQHIIVIGGTRDEYYLDKALAGIRPEYVHKIDWGARMGLSENRSSLR